MNFNKAHPFALYSALAVLIPIPTIRAGENRSEQRRIFFYQLTPIEVDTSIASRQIEVMKEAFSIALKDFQASYPACAVNIDEQLEIPNDETLFKMVKEAATKSGKKAIIGITRSNFARLAAAAARGSDIRGISSAAFTDELRLINENFISISAAWSSQWKITEKHLHDLGCNSSNTVGIFTFRDVLSKHFRTGFLKAGYAISYDSSNFENMTSENLSITSKKCIYMGTSLPGSIKPLSFLYLRNWSGFVVGMGDWTFYTPEMKEFLRRTPGRNFRMFAPLVWTKTENTITQKWLLKNFPNQEVDPLTIGIYDSTKWGFRVWSGSPSEVGWLPYIGGGDHGRPGTVFVSAGA